MFFKQPTKTVAYCCKVLETFVRSARRNASFQLF